MWILDFDCCKSRFPSGRGGHGTGGHSLLLQNRLSILAWDAMIRMIKRSGECSEIDFSKSENILGSPSPEAGLWVDMVKKELEHDFKTSHTRPPRPEAAERVLLRCKTHQLITVDPDLIDSIPTGSIKAKSSKAHTSQQPRFCRNVYYITFSSRRQSIVVSMREILITIVGTSRLQLSLSNIVRP